LFRLFRLFSEIYICLNFDKTFLGFSFIILLEQKVDDLGIVRELPDIPRELPRYVDWANYPGGMLKILS
jgi:hypothetical protein